METATVIEYAGYTVMETLVDYLTKRRGWVVVDATGCNPIPGATWSNTAEGAMQLIDVYLAVEKDGPRFWHLLRAIQRGTINQHGGAE